MSVEAESCGYHTVFQHALDTGNTHELTRMLEERGGKVNVNLYDQEGQTALHRSCLEGNLDIVKILIRYGADIRLANKDGWSALHLASYGGHPEIALYLIKAFKGT